MRFGEYIQKLRETKGLGLSQAARGLGMSAQRLCDIEQGRRNYKRPPPTKLLRLIADLYDHPFSNLVANTEFFQYEKTIVTDLLAEIEPLSQKLSQKAFEMVVESKQYTPEMETLATEAHSLTDELKLALTVAKTRYGKGLRVKAP